MSVLRLPLRALLALALPPPWAGESDTGALSWRPNFGDEGNFGDPGPEMGPDAGESEEAPCMLDLRACPSDTPAAAAADACAGVGECTLELAARTSFEAAVGDTGPEGGVSDTDDVVMATSTDNGLPVDASVPGPVPNTCDAARPKVGRPLVDAADSGVLLLLLASAAEGNTSFGGPAVAPALVGDEMEWAGDDVSDPDTERDNCLANLGGTWDILGDDSIDVGGDEVFDEGSRLTPGGCGCGGGCRRRGRRRGGARRRAGVRGGGGKGRRGGRSPRRRGRAGGRAAGGGRWHWRGSRGGRGRARYRCGRRTGRAE